jgi:hypothetical protein
VTDVTPAGDFCEAKPEHQDYLERYPNGYTCHFPRPNWKLPPARTNSLAHRVAHLIISGADPRRILLMTFSHRAAAEMSRRVEPICGGSPSAIL